MANDEAVHQPGLSFEIEAISDDDHKAVAENGGARERALELGAILARGAEGTPREQSPQRSIASQ